MKTRQVAFLSQCILFSTILAGCYNMRPSNGGGQIKNVPERHVNAKDVSVHPGYSIQPVTSGLTFPTAVTFDDKNTMYVIESGYSYGEVWQEPRLLRVDEDGSTQLIAKGSKNGPWTGVTWYKNSFYIAEGGEFEGGRILRVSMDGKVTALISNLPTMGDHHTNGPVIKDDYIYFGLGVATNSGVVGEDNAHYGWLLRKTGFHDIPCEDIILTGENFTTANVLTEDPNDVATTGSYVPFGT